MAIKIVELWSVSPTDGGAAEQTLPLVYFDMIWLHSPPADTLYFYDSKYSESYFFNTVAVKLKHSLSIALKYFLPFASNIIFPLTSPAMPLSRYTAGDSVALTIATSDADFANLTSNRSRVADEFHQFVPEMRPAVYSSDDVKFSAIAIQVTLFPNKGICIGFRDHHAVCDAASLFGFLRTWASIHKSNGDTNLAQDSLPFYDRSRVQDASKLASVIWEQVKASRPTVLQTNSLPLHKVRASFILSDAEIKKLKKFAKMKNPSASTFVVVCAHLWSCLAESAAAAGEEVDDNETEYLTSAVDCRARLNPPLPDTYFGNCLVFLRARSSHGRLKGDGGFAAAVEAIAAAVREAVDGNGGRGVLDGFENQLQSDVELKGKRVTRIAGSPWLDPCGADYGWGRSIKYEGVHTDYDGAVNLCMAPRGGGVEVGLSMPKLKIDAFAAIFKEKIFINSNL
ncbi:phenolic glucoside malonyltransferase 1-like [Salvia miltiorrhiza]|uniref:phenolic glucoside malonyltransferase 1-like n=1 Tax=Salvia miltiorrhiza TaxID=226208 RepID=UPI0025AC7DB1|nr:phenolic glucoside malonyltransferase 1-like [Salvia miltiorrhiza]